MAHKEFIDQLKNHVRGEILIPGGAAYESARQIWNSRLKKTPETIVRCKAATDVASSIKFARQYDIPFCVRSGGHSYAGLGTCDDTLLIDLSQMDEVRIDKSKKRAYVGPGTKWGKFHEIGIAQGLVTPGATVTSVGVGGFTLGGGSGWLSRKYGLALDNLISVQAVTADGEMIEANERNNSDLFWGIRGGAGNFCVVTLFEFQLHEIPAEVFAGQIIFQFKDAGKVLRAYRELMPETPEEFTCFPAFIRIPPIPALGTEFHGQVAIDLVVAYMGKASNGQSVVEPFQKIAPDPILNAVGVQSYMDVQRSFDAGTPPGQRWYSRAQYLKEISDPAIQTILRHTEKLAGPFTLVYIEPQNGAVSRVDSSATAFPHRNSAYGFHILAGWSDASDDAEIMKWVRNFNDDIRPFSTGGVYVNLLAEDENDRIRAAYGANYDRLRELKRKWDPDNIFRCNQNITPH